MPVLKLNIRRPSKSKQVAQDSSSHQKSKLPEVMKTSTSYKKSMFKNQSRQEGKSSKESSRPRVIVASFNTTDDTESSSVLTNEDGLFDMWGLDSTTNLDVLRRSFTNKESPRSSRPVLQLKSKSAANVIEFKDPETCHPKNRNSWISSSFNADCDADSEDDLDDSIYTLLDDDEECHFRKLSLHDILVEEELSFRKSLIVNDEERSAN
ncbi:hypothetical protein ACHAXN_004090 [Cyclotella atomus]